jgi:hypothetical protein
MLTLAVSGSVVEAFGHWPTGRLGEEVGTFLTIEGVRPLEANKATKGSNKDTQRLLVDTVNGKKLTHPLSIPLDNAVLDAETCYVLRGYETGRMIGDPPHGVLNDEPYSRKYLPNQAAWHFHTSFIVTSVAEPPGVEIDEDPNHTDWIIRDVGKTSVKPATAAPRASAPAKR